jgi:anti-sigma factor RsiW
MTEHRVPSSHGAADELVELALGHIHGRRRTELAAHLLECPSCRHEYEELSAAIGDVIAAVPAVQPPVGFEAKVLPRLVHGRADRRRSWARWLAAVAAGLVLLAGIGLLIARLADGPDQDVVPLRRVNGGNEVGSVSVTELAGEQLVLVAFVGAPPDVSYTCRMWLRDGTAVDSKPWPALERGAWLVDLPAAASDIDRIELLVTGTDRIWSVATL